MKDRKSSVDTWVSGVVTPPLGMWRALLRATGQEPLLRRYRAFVVLARVRMWALLWAIVVPLWIPLDLTLVGGEKGWRLAIGRVVVALCLATAAMICRCIPRQGNVRRAYALLFGSPLLFFIVLAPYVHTTAGGLSLASRTYLDTYQLFPLLVATSIGLLPVTLYEAIVLVGACLAASLMGAGLATPHQLMQPAELGWLWILLVAGGVGTLAGLSQTALLMQNFRDAVTDPLTGLLNRRAGVNLLAMQWEQARRGHMPLTVAMIDLDHFKQINDTHGHDTGDQVLVAFSTCIHAALRAGDALVRWGGEEFLAVMPGATSSDALRRLEQILRERPNLGPNGTPLTFSAGVAEQQEDSMATPEELVMLADQRMYEAKTGGRATVVAGHDKSEDSHNIPD